MTAALGLALERLVPAPEAAPPPPREPYALFPQELGGWSGSPQTLEPGVARILGADDYLAALYSRPDEAAPVDLFLSWYASQTDGAQIDSPEVCLPGAGWEVFRIEPVTVALPGTRTGAVRLNRVVIQKGTRPPARLLLVPGPRPAVHRRFRRPVRQHHRQPQPRAHRRRSGAGDHGDRRRRRRGRRRPPAALPRGHRRPAPPLHPRIEGAMTAATPITDARSSRSW